MHLDGKARQVHWRHWLKTGLAHSIARHGLLVWSRFIRRVTRTRTAKCLLFMRKRVNACEETIMSKTMSLACWLANWRSSACSHTRKKSQFGLPDCFPDRLVRFAAWLGLALLLIFLRKLAPLATARLITMRY